MFIKVKASNRYVNYTGYSAFPSKKQNTWTRKKYNLKPQACCVAHSMPF